jgi:maltose O-acetyltransferase
VLTEDHDPGIPERRAGAMRARGVIVGSGAWIGAGAILLPGAEVGEGCVVAAGAVVSGRLEPHTLCGGVPARVLRELDR